MDATLRRVGYILLFTLAVLVGLAIYNFETICHGQCKFGTVDCAERCQHAHFCPAERGCE